MKKCLGALERQAFPAADFEIIVSDDGSADNTPDIISEFARRNPEPKIHYLWQPNAGANAARNRGIVASRGRILLFINDDTIAAPEMLSEHLRSHELYPQESTVVLGRVTVSPEIGSSLFVRLHLDAGYDLLKNRTELDWKAFYTCNVSVKKSFLLKYGTFEEKMRYHEDLELSERLSSHGLKIIYNPKALGYHHHCLQESEYLDIAHREGKSLAIWYKKSPLLKKELASLGFYPGLPIYRRLKYVIADSAVNTWTLPLLLFFASRLSKAHEKTATILYKKAFQSLKRKAIRDELRKRG